MQLFLIGSYRYTSLLLWLAWTLLLGAALVGRVVEDVRISSIETELKAGSSLVLVVFGWYSVAVSPPLMRPIARLIAVGMTLGCLGDASPLLGSLWPDPQRTLGNMLLFGVGHVSYLRACVYVRRRKCGRSGTTMWYGSLTMWLAVGCVLWYFTAMTGAQHPEMQIPALPYTLLLSATVGATICCALSNRLFVPVAIGATLFLISDLLLAVWIFHDIVYSSFDLVWLSYGVGQMLIVFGTSWFIHGVSKQRIAE